MSVSRVLSGPVLGTAVAGLVLYSVGSSLSTRTHQVTDILHSSSHSLRRLAAVDDTRDLLRSANVAPDTATMVEKLDGERSLHPATGADAGSRGIAKDASVLPAAYRPPASQTLSEQIKARWNEHMTAFAHTLAEADAGSAYQSVSHFARSVYARATGGEVPTKPSRNESLRSDLASAMQALAPSAPQSAATLREPVPPRFDARLQAPNTYYLGQGASLR